jgi:hypothetical protein
MKFYYVVFFHADGGQVCTRGVRCFKDKKMADQLGDILNSERGHHCEDSVVVMESTIPYENEGSFNIGDSPLSTKQHEDKLIAFCNQNNIPWSA